MRDPLTITALCLLAGIVFCILLLRFQAITRGLFQALGAFLRALGQLIATVSRIGRG